MATTAIGTSTVKDSLGGEYTFCELYTEHNRTELPIKPMLLLVRRNHTLFLIWMGAVAVLRASMLTAVSIPRYRTMDPAEWYANRR